jgi:LysR family carnitine catabolism transcriptional activator
MDIKHFRAFEAVARHLHFTKAAEELRVTQPTLSLLIQQLEYSVGVKLLVRSTRQVELTEMGAEFLPFVRNIVNDLEGALSHMSDLSSLKRGKVDVAAFPSVSANQLPSLIVEFRRLHPDIRVKVHDGIWETVIDKVRDGLADFAIASYPEEISGLQFKQMYEDEMILIASPDHPLAVNAEVCWKDIAAEEIVMLSKNTGVRRSIDKALAYHRIVPNAILEPALIQTAAAFVAAGAGLGIILSSYLDVIDTSNIIPIKLKGPVIRRPVGVITRDDRQLTPAAAVLMEMITSRLSTKTST